jgi:hypothetical protein
MEKGPNGEKVWHMFELQSDWGQWVNKLKQEVKERGGPTHTRHHNIPDDPSLNHYESLVLKANIKHALEQGATHIALSDADTAMLTEGHDRAAKSSLLNNKMLLGKYTIVDSECMALLLWTAEEANKVLQDRSFVKGAKVYQITPGY